MLVFYNDRSSFPLLLQMMGCERERSDEGGALAYHNTLVELLAACTEGKNVYTELKCNSLLPLDDIVKVVNDVHCIPEVRWARGYREVDPLVCTQRLEGSGGLAVEQHPGRTSLPATMLQQLWCLVH